jgi:hypothetical protein
MLCLAPAACILLFCWRCGCTEWDEETDVSMIRFQRSAPALAGRYGSKGRTHSIRSHLSPWAPGCLMVGQSGRGHEQGGFGNRTHHWPPSGAWAPGIWRTGLESGFEEIQNGISEGKREGVKSAIFEERGIIKKKSEIVKKKKDRIEAWT